MDKQDQLDKENTIQGKGEKVGQEWKKRFRERYEGANWKAISSRSVEDIISFISQIIEEKDKEIERTRIQTLEEVERRMREIVSGMDHHRYLDYLDDVLTEMKEEG